MTQILVLAFLPCNLSNGVRPPRPFWHLGKMLLPCSTNHSKIGEGGSSRSSSCVQLRHLMVLTTPRNNITTFSTNPFECLSPLTASSSVTSALQHSATRFLNAMIASCVSLFNVISFVPQRVDESCHSLACPGFFDSLRPNYAAHHLLMSVLLHRNARHRLIWYCLRVRSVIWLEKIIVRGYSWSLRRVRTSFLDTWR